MPTYVEIEELIDDCTWTYTTQENSKGVDTYGFLVEGSNGNSIFLPMAGQCVDTNFVEGNGFYWSSSSDYYYYYSEAGDNNLENYGKNACVLILNKGTSKCYLVTLERYYGFTIRPVAD